MFHGSSSAAMYIARSFQGAIRGARKHATSRALSRSISSTASCGFGHKITDKYQKSPTKKVYKSPKKPYRSFRKVFTPQDFTVEEQLPPLALLTSAWSSKALDIEPSVVLDILRKYVQLSKEGSNQWDQFCEG
jgi:hypothetical protein